MREFDRFGREPDEDLRREAIDAQRAKPGGCLCDPDLPGRCPGPSACPEAQATRWDKPRP